MGNLRFAGGYPKFFWLPRILKMSKRVSVFWARSSSLGGESNPEENARSMPREATLTLEEASDG
jgi:hypothetical protein